MPEQSIRFTSIDGRRVAWASVGDGPPLVIGGWWMSHLELDWREPRFREFISALSRYRTVIRYDRPGTGLSKLDAEEPVDLEREVAVLAGIVELVDDERVALFAGSAGGPVAGAYVAANPGAVERLILYGSYANGREVADEAARSSFVKLVREHWGLGSRVLADVFMPGASAAERDAFIALQRDSASAEAAAHALKAVYSFDVSERLAEVQTPTVVLHRRDDRAIDFSLGQELAASIPGATLRALGGSDHLPWHGDSAAVARALLEGLGVADPEVEIAPAPAERPEAAAIETELSERELEVLRLVAGGLSDREIAAQLVLSPHTVHRHVANIRTKLRLPSRAAAAAYAARAGVI